MGLALQDPKEGSQITFWLLQGGERLAGWEGAGAVAASGGAVCTRDGSMAG